jgi:hypothetical protein
MSISICFPLRHLGLDLHNDVTVAAHHCIIMGLQAEIHMGLDCFGLVFESIRLKI